MLGLGTSDLGDVALGEDSREVSENDEEFEGVLEKYVVNLVRESWWDCWSASTRSKREVRVSRPVGYYTDA